MATYDIFAPAHARAIIDPVKRASEFGSRFVFIRDGLSPLAFVFPAAWFLLHGLYLGFFVYMGVLVIVGALASAMTPETVFILFTVFNLTIGMEASRIKRLSYRAFGWQPIGAIIAQSRALAAARYFDDVLGQGGEERAASEHPSSVRAVSSSAAGHDHPATGRENAKPFDRDIHQKQGVIALFPQKEQRS